MAESARTAKTRDMPEMPSARSSKTSRCPKTAAIAPNALDAQNAHIAHQLSAHTAQPRDGGPEISKRTTRPQDGQHEARELRAQDASALEAKRPRRSQAVPHARTRQDHETRRVRRVRIESLRQERRVVSPTSEPSARRHDGKMARRERQVRSSELGANKLPLTRQHRTITQRPNRALAVHAKEAAKIRRVLSRAVPSLEPIAQTRQSARSRQVHAHQDAMHELTRRGRGADTTQPAKHAHALVPQLRRGGRSARDGTELHAKTRRRNVQTARAHLVTCRLDARPKRSRRPEERHDDDQESTECRDPTDAAHLARTPHRVHVHHLDDEHHAEPHARHPQEESRCACHLASRADADAKAAHHRTRRPTRVAHRAAKHRARTEGRRS